MSARATVIIVTHNSASVIEACLNSIPESCDVIVVDNHSTDATHYLVAEICPRAKLLCKRKNYGFGRANNVALEMVKTEFALLLNPDAVLRPDTCDALIAAADNYTNAAIIAPVLLNSDGTQQDNYKNSLFRRKGKTIQKLPEGDICADYLSGAVLLMRMKHLKPYGFFDPAIFMFYEDDDICFRARRYGYGLVVAHQAVAVHLSGTSSPASMRYIYRKNWHMGWSRLYIERKYQGKKAVCKLAVSHFFTYSAKTLGYALLLNKQKTIKSCARTCAAMAYGFKRSAH